MREILHKLLDYVLFNPGFVLIGATVLIQISPIKINPWTFIFNSIRKFLLGDLETEIKEQSKDIQILQKDFEQEKADSKRWNILNYANSCRHDVRHTMDEWRHVMDQIKEYETFVQERGIDNGVIEEEAKYLRRLYAERCEKNDFL